jgi:O-acetylhomoserine/O-acetylserine sulfhydrylase-like pyridoxal-dependent enzyme
MLGQGDHLISRKPSYAGTVKVCAQSAQYGISADFVTSDDVEELIKRIRPNTKVKYYTSSVPAY